MLKRTKHLATKIQFLREMKTFKVVSFEKIWTKENLADITTKQLPKDAFDTFLLKIFKYPGLGEMSRRPVSVCCVQCLTTDQHTPKHVSCVSSKRQFPVVPDCAARKHSRVKHSLFKKRVNTRRRSPTVF